MKSKQKTGVMHLWMPDSVPFFFPGKISPKRNFQNSKKKKKSDFGGFQSPENRKLNVKNHQIFTLGFHCVTKNIERLLKIFILFLFYSQIWLNLTKHDHHFFYMFIWMIATFGYKQFLIITLMLGHMEGACPLR